MEGKERRGEASAAARAEDDRQEPRRPWARGSPTAVAGCATGKEAAGRRTFLRERLILSLCFISTFCILQMQIACAAGDGLLVNLNSNS
jgi:hypothetical protein